LGFGLNKEAMLTKRIIFPKYYSYYFLLIVFFDAVSYMDEDSARAGDSAEQLNNFHH